MAFFVSLDALDRTTTAAEMRGARKPPRNCGSYKARSERYRARAVGAHQGPSLLFERKRTIISRACMSRSRPPAISSATTAIANMTAPMRAARAWCRRHSPPTRRSEIIAVANEVPQLSVLGIAGPGDPC